MKLHQLLAVATSHEEQMKKTTADLKNIFEKKRHLFEEKRTTFTALTEGAQPVVESQSDIQSTIADELKWVAGHMTKAWDAANQIAETNTVARADIITEDGQTLAEGVPATSLLELSKRLAELKALADAIPTLDPAKGFLQDANRAGGIYMAREVVKSRTKKEPTAFVKYAATVEHPAQVDILSLDVPVGTIREQEWSALLTPKIKSTILDRIEILARAVKAARSRANEAEVNQEAKISSALLSYVFG